MVKKKIDHFSTKYFINKLMGITITTVKIAYKIPTLKIKHTKEKVMISNSININPPLRSEAKCSLFAL